MIFCDSSQSVSRINQSAFPLTFNRSPVKLSEEKAENVWHEQISVYCLIKKIMLSKPRYSNDFGFDNISIVFSVKQAAIEL